MVRFVGTYIYVDKKQTVFLQLCYLGRCKVELVAIFSRNSACSTCVKQLIRNLQAFGSFQASLIYRFINFCDLLCIFCECHDKEAHLLRSALIEIK